MSETEYGSVAAAPESTPTAPSDATQLRVRPRVMGPIEITVGDVTVTELPTDVPADQVEDIIAAASESGVIVEVVN